MNEATQILLDHDPCPNVIEADEMHNRVEVIFKQIGEILARSAGPCGAPAIISQYPYHHITKDGYTIRKNISYEKSDGFLDQVIADMCGNICDRLNFAVGDGTTAAILVTCSMYDMYMKNKAKFDTVFLRPSDIIKCMNEMKDDIISRLEKESRQINSLPHEEMVEAIRQVVNISSNGDKELTDMICNIYDEIGFPAITVEMSDDGKMKSEIYDGYLTQVVLTDALYVNNDNMTMEEKSCDVLIYDHKIGMATYENTLRPLAQLCKQRGRRLLILAPYYDTTALPVIAEDLNKEKRLTGSVTLVLMNYRNSGWLAAKKISDLAMLCGTSIINGYMDDLINTNMKKFLSDPVTNKFPLGLDTRQIEGIEVSISVSGENGVPVQTMVPWTNDIPNEALIIQEDERSFRIGYVGYVNAGLNKSTFKDFKVNETLYDLALTEAKKDLDDTIKKYSTMGGFNVEITQKQDRLMSLNMKMGTIHVGADTDFSRNFVKDVVDDCVRAADSAYRNGVIKGCHVSIMRAIEDYIHDISKVDILNKNGKKKLLIAQAFYDSYKNVYKRILLNGSERNPEIDSSMSHIDILNLFEKTFLEKPDHLDLEVFETVRDLTMNEHEIPTLYDFIIDYSIITNKVYDFNYMNFTDLVINSTATDREIFKSAIDLIGLIITGNQLIISRPM